MHSPDGYWLRFSRLWGAIVPGNGRRRRHNAIQLSRRSQAFGLVSKSDRVIAGAIDDFKMARLAHQKLEEIMRRDSHQLKLVLDPSHLYIWNNFTLLHGRERVIEVLWTGVGQTVPEQVIADKYREPQVKVLSTCVDEQWLIHMPTFQLRKIPNLLQNGTDAGGSSIDSTSVTKQGHAFR